MDERWQQRFQNYERAFGLLKKAFENREQSEFSQLEREGVIQRFEYTFELGWKVFKDYLEYSGVILTEATPRRVIKECTSHGVFAEAGIDPQIFINMLLARNALSHRYSQDFFENVFSEIKNVYAAELEKEYDFFVSRLLTND